MSGREDLEARLAKARAERAELEAEREARRVEAELLAEVEAEELAVKNDRAIADAEEKHGRLGVHIGVIETRLGVVIVKRPTASLFKRFQDQGKTDHESLEKLARPCVVYPDTIHLNAILEELPATLVRLADAVVELAGARAREVSGK